MVQLSHTKPYNTEDHMSTYGWSTNIYGSDTMQKLSADQLATHADVRGILGQMAILDNRGWTFHRRPLQDATQKEIDDYSEAIRIGRLTTYPDKHETTPEGSPQRRRTKAARRSYT